MSQNSSSSDIYEQLKISNAQMQAQIAASQKIQAGNRKRMQMELQKKNLAVSIILALFFGPFGLLYSTKKGGLIMIVIGLALTIVAIIIGYIAAESTNTRDPAVEGVAVSFSLMFIIVEILNLASTIWAAIATRKYNREVENNFNA